MCESFDELPEYEIVEYDPDLHDVADMIAGQKQAVESGEAQMLPWVTDGSRLVPLEDLPIYVAIKIGAIGIAMGTYNAIYEGQDPNDVPVVEIGGAFVRERYRGHGIYGKLITARVEYMTQRAAVLLVFANTQSEPRLLSLGFVPAQPGQVPDAAFDLCVSCSKNCTPEIPVTIETCCDRESILVLPSTTDVTVV